MNKNSQGNKGLTVFQREKERQSIGNHERGDKTGEKPWGSRKTMQKKVVTTSNLNSPPGEQAEAMITR
jgi:hypothetical protein